MIRVLFLTCAFAATAHAAEGEVSFSQALDQILDANTQIQIQKQNLEAAEARHTGSVFNFFPTLTVSANEARDVDTDATRKSLSAEASLNVFRFGADLARMQANRAARDAEKAELTATQLKAEEAAVQALVDILVQTEQLTIDQARLDDTKKLLEIAQARYQRGVLAREEVDQVSIDFSNAEAAFRNTQARLNDALAEVTKLSPKADLKVNRLQKAWPWKSQLASANLSKLLAANSQPRDVPALRAAELSLEAARYRAKQAKRSIFPSLDLTYTREKAEQLGIETEASTSVISLSMPIFEGLSDYTAFRVQRAEAFIAETQLRQEQRDVPVRQELARKNLEIAVETANSREKTLSMARKLFDSSLARFRAGRANANALSQDQERVSRAETLAAQGWAQAHLALTEFLHANGRSIRSL